MTMLKESALNIDQAYLDEVVPAGEYWMQVVKKGETVRITDLEGNQAVDTIFINAENNEERYSANTTMRMQRNVYIGLGTEIRSNENRVMLRVSADNCGWHDTLGSACSCESNTARYGHDKRYMHSCRDVFLKGILDWGRGFDKRDQVCNINFFMNVPVDPEGGSDFADGVSAAGKYVEMVAEMDVIVCISNCPQLNNPCNAYNPTPVRLSVWREGE